MKHLILFSLIALLNFSCAEKDQKLQQIEASVIENAMGNDLSYDPIDTKEVSKITYKDYFDVVKTMLDTDENIDKTIERVQYIVDKARNENDGNTYHVWNFNLEGLKKYKSATDKNSTDVKVYEHSYSIINPMFDNQKVTVVNYYFFDSSDKLLGKVSESEMKDFKKDFVKSDKMPYMVAYYESLQ
ncbi:MAG TPA: hypothetical protein DHV22_07960 [Xanthomarina gelatinilytica]|uniref:Uncharacterized protein n=1 Tax=Xanthomarina gelatinilytica TaxID=1137281 RepID=A0A3D6BQI9_9FLAO|nr:hypothetical protein [Xanthomarina gelatinilytica]